MELGTWSTVGTSEESIQMRVMQMRAILMEYYNVRHREHPPEQLTRVADLAVKMSSSSKKRKLKTKGAGTQRVSFILSTRVENSS